MGMTVTVENDYGDIDYGDTDSDTFSLSLVAGGALKLETSGGVEYTITEEEDGLVIIQTSLNVGIEGVRMKLRPQMGNSIWIGVDKRS